MAGLVVGVPKEIKEKEGRVSVQPDGVDVLVYDGREVVVQAGAGSGCGFPDDEYVAARRPGCRHRRRGVCCCGLDRQGQGAHTRGI